MGQSARRVCREEETVFDGAIAAVLQQWSTGSDRRVCRQVGILGAKLLPGKKVYGGLQASEVGS